MILICTLWIAFKSFFKIWNSELTEMIFKFYLSDFWIQKYLDEFWEVNLGVHILVFCFWDCILVSIFSRFRIIVVNFWNSSMRSETWSWMRFYSFYHFWIGHLPLYFLNLETFRCKIWKLKWSGFHFVFHWNWWNCLMIMNVKCNAFCGCWVYLDELQSKRRWSLKSCSNFHRLIWWC